MNRVIKFRAYVKQGDGSWDWLDSDWMRRSDYTGMPYLTSCLEAGEDAYVMQFTGLRDKHGAEIYEGDIVKVVIQVHHSRPVESVRLVAFENAAFYLSHPSISHYCKSLLGNLSYNASVEKIGNIHQHPELLKEAGNE